MNKNLLKTKFGYTEKGLMYCKICGRFCDHLHQCERDDINEVSDEDRIYMNKGNDNYGTW